jgi:hypothetical protein
MFDAFNRRIESRGDLCGSAGKMDAAPRGASIHNDEAGALREGRYLVQVVLAGAVHGGMLLARQVLALGQVGLETVSRVFGATPHHDGDFKTFIVRYRPKGPCIIGKCCWLTAWKFDHA